MHDLWRSLRSCEKLMRNGVLPSDALQTKLMDDHNFNERKMIYTVALLLRSILLYYGGHPLIISTHGVGEIHHSHHGKMHQQFDMVGI